MKRIIIGVCPKGHEILGVDDCCVSCECGYGYGSSHEPWKIRASEDYYELIRKSPDSTNYLCDIKTLNP